MSKTPTYYSSARGQRVTLARCWRELKIHGHEDRQSHTEFIDECWQVLATIEEGDKGVRKINAQELLNWLGY